MASTTEPGQSVPAPVAATPAPVVKGKKSEGPAQITQEELRTALTRNSTKLVEELWTITQKQVDFEVARHGRLETKATGLLTATGLSLTVAFTFGATLLKEGDRFGNWYYANLLWFGLSCIAGLVAASLAFAALMLREQKWVNEHSLFSPRVLEHADVPDNTKPEELAALEAAGLAEFRKAMIPHLWEIRQTYHEKYKKKAEFVRIGQIGFLTFLGCLLALCICNVMALSNKHSDAKEEPAKQTASAAPAQAPIPTPAVVPPPISPPQPVAPIASVSAAPSATASASHAPKSPKKHN